MNVKIGTKAMQFRFCKWDLLCIARTYLAQSHPFVNYDLLHFRQ